MDLLVALQSSGAAQALRGSTWLYPGAAFLHALGACLAVGAIVLVDLRLLGMGKGVSRDALLAFALPVALGGAALAVLAGLAMFATGAAHFARNPAFLFKMAMLVFAVWNAVAFHRFGADRAPIHALASLVAWIAVVAAGTLTAYF
jgi:hypothetical protein